MRQLLRSNFIIKLIGYMFNAESSPQQPQINPQEKFKKQSDDIQKQRKEALARRMKGEIGGVELDKIEKELAQQAEEARETLFNKSKKPEPSVDKSDPYEGYREPLEKRYEAAIQSATDWQSY
ncbi:MAG: hypothetical protein V1707_03090 [bacterium]